MTPADATSYAFRVRDALHIPRRALDSMTVEVAILIGELCETPEQAETLTAAILAQPWGRFDLPEFRRRVESLAGRTPPTETAPLDTFDPSGPFTATEHANLKNYALKNRLTVQYQGRQCADIYAAHNRLTGAASTLFSKLKPADRAKLIEHCRAEREAAYAAYARIRSRDRDHFTDQPRPHLALTPSSAHIEEWAVYRLYLESVGERNRFDKIPLPEWLQDSVQTPPELGVKTIGSTI